MILVPDYISVRELAELIQASPIDVMKKLIANGIMASINQQIDYDTAALVIEEMGFEAQSASAVAAAEAEKERAESTTQEWRTLYTEEKPENLDVRPPIVTILGHVDHGKTTLLDTIRKAHVAEGEAGGITQHIGAYTVMHEGRPLTFLDTPGHEAFTAMRARGAQGADIAVLVVAADDGVMPTTREALDHARAANVPIVVAITKVDKGNANPERVKQQLSELELVPDEWDGDTLMVPVASVKGEGIEDLLEALLLVADDSRIVANPKAKAAGVVIESEIDASRGTLATLLVLNGTLKRGDTVLAGKSHGRIKAMFDHTGAIIKQAGPSTPVLILGLNEPPEPGTQFEWVKDDKTARALIGQREDAMDEEVAVRPSVSLEDVFAQFAAGETKTLNLILRADVQGSIQPIVDSLKDLHSDDKDSVNIKILSAEVGDVSENDVNLAGASSAIILAFNVSVDNAAERAADAHHVEIRSYNIIYKLLEDIELALHGLLEPEYAPKQIGVAEVRQVFRISKVGAIAGSYILSGEARRGSGVHARVLRGGEIIVEDTTVSSLKRFNEDVREVRTGFECGIGLNKFNEFEEGDRIEFFVMERIN